MELDLGKVLVSPEGVAERENDQGSKVKRSVCICKHPRATAGLKNTLLPSLLKISHLFRPIIPLNTASKVHDGTPL